MTKPEPYQEPLDESFEIISEKEKLLRAALKTTETEFIKAEVNVSLCGKLISYYKEEIEYEAENNAK